MVFCSPMTTGSQVRSAWHETACVSSTDTSSSRRTGRKVRKSEHFWAFFERMSTSVHSLGCRDLHRRDSSGNSVSGCGPDTNDLRGPRFTHSLLCPGLFYNTESTRRLHPRARCERMYQQTDAYDQKSRTAELGRVFAILEKSLSRVHFDRSLRLLGWRAMACMVGSEQRGLRTCPAIRVSRLIG